MREDKNPLLVDENTKSFVPETDPLEEGTANTQTTPSKKRNRSSLRQSELEVLSISGIPFMSGRRFLGAKTKQSQNMNKSKNKKKKKKHVNMKAFPKILFNTEW